MGSSKIAEKLQELLNTKGSAENEVMDLLGNPALIKHLMTLTDQQETFLHLAIKHSSQDVLTTLLQLYRESNLLQSVLRQKNSDHCNPLRLAILYHHFEKTVQLFKECLAEAEDAITALDPKDSSILHCIASSNSQSIVTILKFLLGYPQCHALLLFESTGYIGINNATPLKIAKHYQWIYQQQYDWAKQRAQTGSEKLSEFHKKHRIDIAVKFPKEKLQIATEIVTILEMPTTEAKLKQSELKAKQNQEERVKQQNKKLESTLSQLLQLQRWEDISDYLLSDNISIRRGSIEILADLLPNNEIKLPLDVQLLAMIKNFLQSPENDSIVIPALRVLLVASKNDENIQLIMNDELLLSVLQYLLCSLDQEIQTMCATVIATLAAKQVNKYV